MLSPEIWEDAQFGQLTPPARLLFIGMISNADDEGIGEASIPSLKRLVFGFDDFTNQEVKLWFEEIQDKMRSVQVYESDGRKYYHLLNWHDYQRIDRPKPSKFPPPPHDYSGDGNTKSQDKQGRFFEVVRAWEQVWGTINPKAVMELEDLVNDWETHISKLPEGSQDKNVSGVDCLLKAINTAVCAVNRPNLNYVKAIINNWISHGYQVNPTKKQSKTDMPELDDGFTQEELNNAV